MDPPQHWETYTGMLGRMHDDPLSTSFFDRARNMQVTIHSEKMLPAQLTIYDAQVTSRLPHLQVRLGESTKVIEVGTHPAIFGRYVVDLCAGSGAMGQSTQFLGAEVLASMDFNSLAVKHLQELGHGRIFHADVSDLKAIQQLHDHVKGLPFTMLAGFPCQPYSQQGLRLGAKDQRATTLVSILDAAILLQPQAVLLECVTGAADEPAVHTELNRFCQIQQWQKQEVQLELSHQWPMARKRWWVVLYPTEWGQFQLQPWPQVQPKPEMRDILPTLGEWPEHEEVELMLSQHEHQCYLSTNFGTERRLLLPTDTVPTALHSYSVAYKNAHVAAETQLLGTTR